MQLLGLSPLLIIAVVVLFSSIKILNEYERGVVFTLGRYSGTRGPGLVFVFPVIQQIVTVSLRTVVLDIPPQDVITRDNVSLKVNAVIYYRAIDPSRAVLQVENYYVATSQLSQTTLRSVVGKSDLDDLLSNRDKINAELQQILDQHTEPWGVKVSNVEVKNVDLPVEMQRAMARQAEAERERRAKVIHAEGELQASQKLGEAAVVMSRDPAAIQLRYLQTLTEIAADKNSTILFPVPIDFMASFIKQNRS
ncbi:MAG: slipin family protein [Elusimicrobia bacterium]|nr:slipin family protein [Elusimicrobiota bacterium]